MYSDELIVVLFLTAAIVAFWYFTRGGSDKSDRKPIPDSDSDRQKDGQTELDLQQLTDLYIDPVMDEAALREQFGVYNSSHFNNLYHHSTIGVESFIRRKSMS